jgi:hypothetical protein
MPTLLQAARKKAEKDAKAEALVTKAIKGVQNKTYANVMEACRELNILPKYTTVTRQMKTNTLPWTAAHSAAQLLTPTQEAIVVKWIEFLAFAGVPLSKKTIGAKVYALCGRKPSRRWANSFLVRHRSCKLGKPAGLDSKRARAFNFTTVNQYFERFQNLLDSHGGIPASNIYNFDEIGIQMGGGRKSSGELYFFSARDKTTYKIRSENLQLVTILETICRDGTAPVKPCLVFPGVKMFPEWFQVDNDILYVAAMCIIESSC